jgi:hypothetical protein
MKTSSQAQRTKPILLVTVFALDAFQERNITDNLINAAQ